MNERLARQIAFLVEADKLKSIVRRTSLVDLSRLENSAEHSWHLVLVIMVMREYGPPDIDWMRVMEMVAVHDLVEIDAGDVSAYNVDASKAVREQAAADRIFASAPSRSARAVPATMGRVRGACHAGSAVRQRRRSTAAAPSERPRGGGSWRGPGARARADPGPDGADRIVAARCVAARARRGRVVLCGGGITARLAVLQMRVVV